MEATEPPSRQGYGGHEAAEPPRPSRPPPDSADRTRRGWKGASMSENQTTMAPQAICQDVAEKGYEGLVLTRH